MSFIFTSSCFVFFFSFKEVVFPRPLCSFLSGFVIDTHLREKNKTMKIQTFCTSVSYVLALQYSAVNHKLKSAVRYCTIELQTTAFLGLNLDT